MKLLGGPVSRVKPNPPAKVGLNRPAKVRLNRPAKIKPAPVASLADETPVGIPRTTATPQRSKRFYLSVDIKFTVAMAFTAV